MAVGVRQFQEEPMWGGKRLSEWMDGHVRGSPEDGSAEWKLADDAIRQIGTNGIPTLLRMISTTEADTRSRLARFAWDRRWTKKPYRPATQLNEEAKHAFEVLGTNAASAVPELIRIYETTRSISAQACTATALGKIG